MEQCKQEQFQAVIDLVEDLAVPTYDQPTLGMCFKVASGKYASLLEILCAAVHHINRQVADVKEGTSNTMVKDGILFICDECNDPCHLYHKDKPSHYPDACPYGGDNSASWKIQYAR